MARRNGLFDAFMLQFAAEEAAKHPAAPKPRELTPAEKAERRRKQIAESYQKDYADRKAKEDAESKIAQENGRRADVFRDYRMTPEEQRTFARTKPELIPELLAQERRCRPNPEINRLYELLTPRLIGGKQ